MSFLEQPSLYRGSKTVSIKQTIASRIASGEWPVGSSLPSEAELSAELQVSRTTVRRVLAELVRSGQIEKQTGRPARVLSAVPAHADKQFEFIAVVAPIGEDSWLGQRIFQGVLEAARKTAYPALLFNTFHTSYLETLRLERDQLALLLRSSVVGVVLLHQGEMTTTAPVQAILDAGIPLVAIDRGIPGVDCDTVVSDNFTGAYMATEHLIAHGHRRIGHITVPHRLDTVRARREGYCQALRDHGIPVDPELIVFHREDYVANGRHAALQLLQLPDPPTAIFAIIIESALGAMEAIQQELGLRVPEDLSLVCFDRPPDLLRHFLPLTCVEQPQEEMGRQAVRLIMERLADTDQAPRLVQLPTRLIRQGSSGPPPSPTRKTGEPPFIVR